jgi:hypothetical protein
MSTDALKRAKKKYMSKLVRFEFRLSSEKDADMIGFLRSRGNITAYLKRLIRNDMKDEGIVPASTAKEKQSP